MWVAQAALQSCCCFGFVLLSQASLVAWPLTCYTSEDDLGLPSLTPLPPKCWDCKPALSHRASGPDTRGSPASPSKGPAQYLLICLFFIDGLMTEIGNSQDVRAESSHISFWKMCDMFGIRHFRRNESALTAGTKRHTAGYQIELQRLIL